MAITEHLEKLRAGVEYWNSWRATNPHLKPALRGADLRGLDLRGILRAGAVNLRAGGIVQGGSTITQQTVKNLFLGQERTWWRKLREGLTAVLLSWTHGHPDQGSSPSGRTRVPTSEYHLRLALREAKRRLFTRCQAGLGAAGCTVRCRSLLCPKLKSSIRADIWPSGS